MFGPFIDKWNSIIYPKDEKGNFLYKSLSGHDVWERWNIETWPVHKNRCASRCPYLWAEDIDWMMQEIQRRLGNKVFIIQLKEKWDELTVYFDAEDDEAKTIMNEIIAETKLRLVAKGLHPSKEELNEQYG